MGRMDAWNKSGLGRAGGTIAAGDDLEAAMHCRRAPLDRFRAGDFQTKPGPPASVPCFPGGSPGPVQAVAGIPDARNDIAVVVQPFVDGGGEDWDVRVGGVEGLEPFRRRQEATEP